MPHLNEIRDAVVRTVALTRRGRQQPEAQIEAEAEVKQENVEKVKVKKVKVKKTQAAKRVRPQKILATPPPYHNLGYQTPSPPLLGKRRGPDRLLPSSPSNNLGYQTPSSPLIGRRKEGPDPLPTPPSPPPMLGKRKRGPIFASPPSDDEPGPSKKAKGKGKEEKEPESEMSSVGEVDFVRKGCAKCLEREQLERRARTRRNSF